jgi:DNA-directed RNA polymerase subunit RPC12/RpoP
MICKCAGCGKAWNVSIKARIPKTGYICPHCESKARYPEIYDRRTPAWKNDKPKDKLHE